MPTEAKILGFLGLIPFVALPLFVLTGILAYFESYLYFVQYSAIILSFFGGIHWFAALANNGPKHQLYMAMLPSIVAWLSLIMLDGEMLLSTLSIAYIGVLIYDKYSIVMEKHKIIEYISLRMVLTSIVVLCHLTMAFI